MCVCVCERERERERERKRGNLVWLVFIQDGIIVLQDWFFETDTTCTPQILQVFIGFLSGHRFTGLEEGNKFALFVLMCLEQVFAVWFFG